MKTNIILFALSASIFFISCGKKSERTGETSVKDDTKKEVTADQEKQRIEDSIQAASDEMKLREKKLEEAKMEQLFLDDPNGQWAVDAEASTNYGKVKNDDPETKSWSNKQLTGKPNVESYGDDGRAWAPETQDKGLEWVVLKYLKPVNATEIRVRQSYNPGAIVKIELYDENNKPYVVFDGIDKTKYEANKISYFIQKLDKTSFKTKKIKITLATNTVNGWNEIDAVQLVGE